MKSLLVIGILVFVSIVNGQSAAVQPDKEAERLWELAIKAKGGRERLIEVGNLLVQQGKPYDRSLKGRNVGYQVSLFVFPDKAWSWNDQRPSVFGLDVGMRNYETGMYYNMTPDDPAKNLKQLPPSTEQGIPYDSFHLIYFMETKWLKPTPLKARKGKSHNKLADIVEVSANGQRWEFYLDIESHLPFQLNFFTATNGKETEGDPYYLSDYAEVNGIKVPQNVVREYGEKSPSKVQINVNYDASIFTAPTKLEDGPNAWQAKNDIQIKTQSPPETKQTISNISDSEINALVKQIADEDADKRGAALDKILEIGKPAIPFLTKQLSDRKKLVVLWTAQTLLQIDTNNQDALSALLKILKSGEGMTERAAAFAMASSPTGIRMLADLLEDKNTFVRRSVVFAFDDLTERDLSPDELKAMDYAEPKIKKAVNDKDQTVSEMAEEVLGQLGRRRAETSNSKKSQ